MSDSLRIAVVGLGKMGLSHFSMVNAHPRTETHACDASGFMVDILSRNCPAPFHKDYTAMLESTELDAVVIATPSSAHAPMVRAALEKGLHVFCEKPFCLRWQDAMELADLAESKGLVNQVGYHYRHVGAFQEMKRVLESGAIGRVTHVLAEAYGPVVLRPRKQSWRTTKSEGGGCLYDYAAHPLNLLNWYFGMPTQVTGSVLNSVFSEGTDDEVFSTLRFDNGPTAQLSVNWSDESHRKMSTKISMIGTGGRIFADRQECQVYLREVSDALPGYDAGWNVKYTTELSDEAWFYLRGEEYSHQVDQFVQAALGDAAELGTDFRAAAITDQSIAMILENAETGTPVGEAPAVQAPVQKKRSWFGR